MLWGWLQRLLQDVPLNAALRERVKLADQKYDAALRENEQLKQKVGALQRESVELRAQNATLRAQNATLRAQIPHATVLSDDTKRVLVHLYKARQAQEIGAMATALGIEKGLVRYHLERLSETGLVRTAGSNYRTGHAFWAVTLAGRRRVVEDKLT